MLQHRIAYLAIAACALNACDRATAPVAPLPLCGFPTTITASAGSVPAFEWSSSCRATGLYVRREDSPGTSVWSIGVADTTKGIASPVTYAQLPSGATQSAAALPLAVGTAYRVTITIPNGSGFVLVVGNLTFTP